MILHKASYTVANFSSGLFRLPLIIINLALFHTNMQPTCTRLAPTSAVDILEQAAHYHLQVLVALIRHMVGCIVRNLNFMKDLTWHVREQEVQ